MDSEKRKRRQDEASGYNEPKQTVLSHEAYTVGWVCALPKEQTAAIAMLDKRHPNIPKMQPPTDTNAYTLGSIGGHNIVIACLPKGQIGVVSAATVATNLVSTFSSIKIGLMVGIGGGIPSNKVRLGDVVVSTPTGPHPGVIQWDLGKATDGGRFERTGSLNNPPTTLLAALTKLESCHEMDGSKIHEYLTELGRKYPKLISKYLRSEALRDVLFKADCAHVDGDDTSSDEDDKADPCRYCDRTKSKQRKLRDTRIHYGVIASGNMVIKDGVFRDKLNVDLGGNVLCVEMEAAGLMTNFPCLVIRGICDYADSHKNKEWQEHAAAVAAACAKEFLAHMGPEAIQAERSANDILHNIINITSSAASDAKHIRNHVMKEEAVEMLKWLTSFEYGTQHSDIFAKYQRGTGQWFLDSNCFRDWVASTHRTLFCPGIPGSGKTMIASLVIESIMRKCDEDQSIGLAYAYCNYQSQRQQDLNSLLANFLAQLSQSLESFPESVEKLYKRRFRDKTRPSIKDLESAIIAVSGLRSRIFFVVDALDECMDHCRSNLLQLLSRIQDNTAACIMYTSRPLPKIESFFVNSPTQPIRAEKKDLEIFIETRLTKALENIPDIPGFAEELKSRMPNLVDGMFLIVHLCLNAFREKTTVAQVRQVLADLEGHREALRYGESESVLDKAYDQAMERIERQPFEFKALGMKTLSWVFHAERPLTAQELQHAVAISAKDKNLKPENLQKIETIISACAGLITKDERSEIVRLAHATTQEYFILRHNRYFSNAQMDITSACIAYSRFRGLWEHMSVNHSKRCTGFVCRLSAYVASNWGHHARKVPGLHAMPTVMDFLADEDCVSNAWAYIDTEVYAGMWDSGQTRKPSSLHSTAASGLRLAAHFNLLQAGKDLIKGGLDVDGDPNRGTPLMLASRLGNEEFVELLLDKGATVDKTDRFGRTALVYAWVLGHETVVAQLLDKGANLQTATAGPIAKLHGYEPIDFRFYDTWQSKVLMRLYRQGDEEEIARIQREIETEWNWLSDACVDSLA